MRPKMLVSEGHPNISTTQTQAETHQLEAEQKAFVRAGVNLHGLSAAAFLCGKPQAPCTRPPSSKRVAQPLTRFLVTIWAKLAISPQKARVVLAPIACRMPGRRSGPAVGQLGSAISCYRLIACHSGRSDGAQRVEIQRTLHAAARQPSMNGMPLQLRHYEMTLQRGGGAAAQSALLQPGWRPILHSAFPSRRLGNDEQTFSRCGLAARGTSLGVGVCGPAGGEHDRFPHPIQALRGELSFSTRTVVSCCCSQCVPVARKRSRDSTGSPDPVMSEQGYVQLADSSHTSSHAVSHSALLSDPQPANGASAPPPPPAPQPSHVDNSDSIASRQRQQQPDDLATEPNPTQPAPPASTPRRRRRRQTLLSGMQE